MTSRERLGTALNHQPPDRVPIDLGSMPFSGITRVAYRNYLAMHGLLLPEPPLQDLKQQLVVPDPQLLDMLGVDTRPLRRGRLGSQARQLIRSPDGRYEQYHDEWGLGWRRPVPDGLYFDLFEHPLAACRTTADLAAWDWPDPVDPRRFDGIEDEADRATAEGHALVVGGLCAGIWEMALWLRGYDQFYLDMAAEPDLAGWLIGHMVELKLAYWQALLARIGDRVSVCFEADDLAGQHGLLVSAAMYRRLVKPHQRRLFEGLRAACPRAKLLYHTDGALREVLPDLVDLGIDILNPIQVNAAGMDDTAWLKREYGRDLCFWGGACDSQRTLPHGTPDQVREEVKRRLNDLAPGGGYVFAGVHNIQADVPPQNLEALWQAFRDEVG